MLIRFNNKANANNKANNTSNTSKDISAYWILHKT